MAILPGIVQLSSEQEAEQYCKRINAYSRYDKPGRYVIEVVYEQKEDSDYWWYVNYLRPVDWVLNQIVDNLPDEMLPLLYMRLSNWMTQKLDDYFTIEKY